MVERCPDKTEVEGPIPSAPTLHTPYLRCVLFLNFHPLTGCYFIWYKNSVLYTGPVNDAGRSGVADGSY